MSVDSPPLTLRRFFKKHARTHTNTQLVVVAVLDLLNNTLSGNIPTELVHMRSLEYLDLSGNDGLLLPDESSEDFGMLIDFCFSNDTMLECYV